VCICDYVHVCQICSICHDDMTLGSSVSVGRCGHRFHADCVIASLRIRSSCPMCRDPGHNAANLGEDFDDGFGMPPPPFGMPPPPFGMAPPPFGMAPPPFGMVPPPFGMAPPPFGMAPPPAAPAAPDAVPGPPGLGMLEDGPACRMAASWLLGPSGCEDVDDCVTPVCKSGARVLRV